MNLPRNKMNRTLVILSVAFIQYACQRIEPVIKIQVETGIQSVVGSPHEHNAPFLVPAQLFLLLRGSIHQLRLEASVYGKGLLKCILDLPATDLEGRAQNAEESLPERAYSFGEIEHRGQDLLHGDLQFFKGEEH